MIDDHPSVGPDIARCMSSRRILLGAIAAFGAIASGGWLGLRSALAATDDSRRPTASSFKTVPLPVAGSGDSLFAALQEGEWVSARDSQTIRQAISRYAPNYKDFGDTGITAITSAWSGAAFDPDTGTFYVMGGGHHDSNFNGIVSLNVETGLAAMPIHPSIITATEVAAMKASWPPNDPWNDWGHAMYPGYPPPSPRPGAYPGYPRTGRVSGPYPGYVYPDGLPGASHTYGCMWYDASGKVINFNAFWSVYDIVGGKVSSLTPHNAASRGPNNFGLKVANRLIGVNTKVDTYWYFAQFDLGTLTETSSEMSVPYQPGISAAYSFNSKTFGCAIGNTMYFVDTGPGNKAFGDPTAWSVDISHVTHKYTAKIIPIVNPWSDRDMAGVQGNTMAFDSDQQLLYIPAKDWSYFLIWNPATGECSRMSTRGGLPKTQVNSAYGRLQYYAKRRCLVLVNSIEEPLYYLKIA